MARAPTEIRSLARAQSSMALNALRTIAARGKSESARVAAAVALLDRGWGKPDQSINVTNRNIREYSDAELLAIVATGGEGDTEAPKAPAELH